MKNLISKNVNPAPTKAYVSIIFLSGVDSSVSDKELNN